MSPTDRPSFRRRRKRPDIDIRRERLFDQYFAAANIPRCRLVWTCGGLPPVYHCISTRNVNPLCGVAEPLTTYLRSCCAVREGSRCSQILAGSLLCRLRKAGTGLPTQALLRETSPGSTKIRQSS